MAWDLFSWMLPLMRLPKRLGSGATHSFMKQIHEEFHWDLR